MSNCCEVCRFSKNEGNPHGDLACRRHAPVVAYAYSGISSGSPTYDWRKAWPKVRRTDWCGDFERFPKDDDSPF